jgi:hypothetical protein
MQMASGLGGLVLLLMMVGSGVFIIVYGMRLRAQQNERLAILYQKALESGQDPISIQRALQVPEQADPQGNLKAGIILLASALGMAGGIWAASVLPGPGRLLGFALVPALIGCAVIVIHFTIPRPPPHSA